MAESSGKTVFRWIGQFVLAVIVLVLLAVLYLAFKPIEMHRYTLTNGDRVIVFQEMIHLAEPSFYDQVLKDEAYYKRHGYRFVYERVRGTPQQEAALIKLLGLPSGYLQKMAPALGLDTQSSPRYWGMIGPHDVNADLTADQVLNLAQAAGIKPESVPPSEDRLLAGGPPHGARRFFLHALVRLMLNARDILPKPPQMEAMMHIILQTRNQRLFQVVQSLPDRKILIHYGMLHFAGWWAMQQHADPRWHIIRDVAYRAL